MTHQALRAADLSTREAYQLMTDLVAPRPIAWVSTLSADGAANLAPFSYFQGVCSRPPTIAISIAWHRDGRPKDTLRNILATGQFVVNHVDRDHAEVMNLTSGEYPAGRSEWDVVAAAGMSPLTALPSTSVAPPRVGEAKAALECNLTRAIPLGTGAPGRPSSTLVLGEIQIFWLASDLVARDERGRLRPLDPAQLAAIGRLGGIAYTETVRPFHMARPKP